MKSSISFIAIYEEEGGEKRRERENRGRRRRRRLMQTNSTNATKHIKSLFCHMVMDKHFY
jgi:hypothetical protein